MIYFPVGRGGSAVRRVQTKLLPVEPRFAALSELEQNQTHRPILMVPQETQPLGFQRKGSFGGNQLRQPLRAVDKKEVAAVFYGVGCRLHQFPGSAQILPPGQRCISAGRAAGKIRRI